MAGTRKKGEEEEEEEEEDEKEWRNGAEATPLSRVYA